MKRCLLFSILMIALLGVGSAASADQIDYTLTDLGSGNWQYTYTITNTSIPGGVYLFDIYFPSVFTTDPLAYSAITETANQHSADWMTQIFPPSAPNLGAAYDVSTTGAPLWLNQSVSGFSVSFHYAGNDPLGVQEFELYDDNFHLLESGLTEPVTAPAPEPSTLSLFGSALAGLAGTRKWRSLRLKAACAAA